MRNVRMTIWVMVASLCLINSMALADCPPADLTGNCKVDFEDFAVMASEWLAGGVPEGEGVTFGKLVVERLYRDDDVFVDFVKRWLDGTGTTADAELIYRGPGGVTVREVFLYGLRPTSYYTIPQGDYSVEHIEFSVEHVDIVNLGVDAYASSSSSVFGFGGTAINFLSVKPPEIYFGVELQSPQFFDNFHVNVEETLFGQTNIIVSEMGMMWEDNLWEQVSGGGIDIKYVQGNISEAKGEDVTLTGRLTGNRERRWLVDWTNSWIDNLEFPQGILISYVNDNGMPFYQGNFINAMPTSYILPTVNSASEELLQESFSFTYDGTTE